MTPRAPLLDAPAPRWVVRATDWLSCRWWLPQGLAKAWGCGYHREFYAVFYERDCPPPVAWAHIVGRRNYRRDADAAYNDAYLAKAL